MTTQTTTSRRFAPPAELSDDELEQVAGGFLGFFLTDQSKPVSDTTSNKQTTSQRAADLYDSYLRS